MSHPRKSGSAWLPVMAVAFPHTFFADLQQVQPLKIEIDRDLSAVLLAGMTPYQLRCFLYWYVNRRAYRRALLGGKGRIDLTGAVVDDEIPAAIREQARERWQQLQATRQNAQSANPTGTRPADRDDGVVHGAGFCARDARPADLREKGQGR